MANRITRKNKQCRQNNQKTEDKIEALSSHITIILNVNGFNSSIKRHRVA